MNEINEKFLNALKAQIEEAEKIDPNYELLGINSAFVSNNTEDCRLCYLMNPNQIEEKDKELESAISDPKVRRYVAEFDILLQNLRFGLGAIIDDAEAEGLITDEEKFFKFFPYRHTNNKSSDCDTETTIDDNLVKPLILNMAIAFAHQN